jgi:pilus assembly protein CpaE
VVLPEDGEMLRRAVREAAYANDAQEEAGRLVSICGSKGGSGVTLLTANLAAELASFHRVVALDFDFTMGDMAPYLDLTVQSNLQDLMKSIARLDDRMLGGSVLVHPSKLHVLAQPIEPSQGTEVSELSAVSLLRACARMYQFVLADCGSKGDPIALTTLLVSDLVLLICTPDVPSVRNAWRRVCLMERIGVERERIRLVVNRWTRAAPISLGEIRENLGMEIACTISNDSKTAIQATNDGRLLRDVNPRSRAARDIARMVDLATEERRAIDLDEGGGLLGRLFS